MKKRIVSTALILTFISSVGFAAPVLDLKEGETAIGLTYTKPSTTLSGYGESYDLDKPSNVGAFIEYRGANNFNIGLERQSYSYDIDDINYTDVYGRYQVGKNMHLIAGLRQFDSDGYSSDTYFLYGLGYSTKLDDNLSGYASYTKADISTTYDIGVNYTLSSKAVWNLGYRSIKLKDDGISVEAKGLSTGIAIKF